MSRALTTAEIIAVGSELLGWTRLDTNSLFITEKLAALGIEVKGKSVVGDDGDRLKAVFAASLRRADLVILTGGLGPTDDDLTREVIAEALGLSMLEDPEITATIARRFSRRGMQMPEVNRRQAMVPRGAAVLPNPLGSAPGLFIEADDKVVVLLPGPPRELQPMLSALCEAGALSARAGATRVFKVSLFTTQRSESHVEELVQPIYSQWRRDHPPIETTILATPGQVELHLSVRGADEATAMATLEAARQQLADALGDCAFTTDGRPLHRYVGDLLRERRLTLAAAESCTGGLLLERLTDVPGSSDYVAGGIVAYTNGLKTTLLGVDPELLERHGAVSEPVAAAMAEGVRERSGADVAVAITGIAGPGGGSPEKPVGTVVIAVLVPGRASVDPYAFVPGWARSRPLSGHAGGARYAAPASSIDVRLFVAAEPSPSVRRAAADVGFAIRDALEASRGLPRIRWVPPENLHLTLRFLGEVPDDRSILVLDALRAPVRRKAFRPSALRSRDVPSVGFSARHLDRRPRRPRVAVAHARPGERATRPAGVRGRDATVLRSPDARPHKRASTSPGSWLA